MSQRRISTLSGGAALAAVVLSGSLDGCTGGSRATGSQPGRGADRAAGWRADIRQLVADATRLNPDLDGATALRLTREADRLAAQAPQLDADQLMTGVMHLSTLIPATGRDGHTGVFVWGRGNRPVHSLPLRWWFFRDGLVVEDQLGGRDLVGARVVAVEGRPLAEVVRLVDPLVPHDNPTTVQLLRPRFLLTPEVLHGVGVLHRVGPVRLDLVTAAGDHRTVTVAPGPIARYNGWAGSYGLDHVDRRRMLFLTNMDRVLWHRLVGRALYVAYNRVEPIDDAELASIRRLARSDRVDRIVVDVRHNFGGEVDEDAPLLDVLTGAGVRNKPLFLLTGRNTFSAGVLFAAKLADQRAVVVVGEPTGGAPTAYGNSEDVRLVHSGLVVSVATTTESALGSGDGRTAVTPDVDVVLSSADYFADRDPVLAAALAAPR